MSYSIYIGQAELESEWSPDEIRAEWTVAPTTHPDAPFKDDLAERSNGCHPGYSQWAEAMREVGLYHVWFGTNGRRDRSNTIDEWILRDHPGIVALTWDMVKAFESARSDYLKAHPGKRSGICYCATCNPFERHPERSGEEHDPTRDFNIDRLDWMCFWARWAMENCSRPAISNS